MRLSRCLALILVSVFLIPLTTRSQQIPQGVPAPPVIRINVNLVQVDAVVTDSRGNPVTGLTLEDFELLQDGKPQVITNFEFVDVKSGLRPLPTRGAPPNGPPPPGVPARGLRPQQVRRTIAFVVDDLGLSFDSITRVRDSIRKWVDNEMQPTDLAAVIRTSAGMGALQQFTADKRILRASLDLVRFHLGRVGTSSFAPMRAAGPDGSPDTSNFDRELDQVYRIGSMGAIQYVIQGLREVPGRKSLVLFSESMQLSAQGRRDQDVEERLRRLGDAANRSSVVIYGVDPRGVVYTGLTAEDGGGGLSPQRLAQVASDRTNQLLYSREGMETLAEKTGGLFLGDTNDITSAVRKVVDDGNGYYLLGYQPAAETFQPAVSKFHSITVRVKRPGLTVRSRTGFFGTPDRGIPPPRTPIQQITRALSSPFATGDLQVRLTTLFGYTEKSVPYLNALLYIDANGLTFVKEADGNRTATVDIAAVTFDVDGNQIEGASKTWRFRLPEETYRDVLKSGLVYSMHVPVKKPGPYQMRVVLRDTTSQRLGSSTQFTEVPDIKKGRLTLSGIVMGADRTRVGIDSTDGQIVAPDPNETPAVRIFKQGTTVVYAYAIFNARADRNKKAQLEVQARLFRDGQQVYTGAQVSMSSDAEQKTQLMAASGRLQLTQVTPGDYILQVVVTDKLAGDKYKVAAQSIDFVVRP